MCTSSLLLYGLSRGCVSKVEGCMVQVPIWVLPASAGVWGVTLAATPFALVQLVVGCPKLVGRLYMLPKLIG